MNKKIKLMDIMYSKTMCFIVSTLILLSYCYITPVHGLQSIIEIVCYMMLGLVLLIYILNGKYSSFSIILLLFIITLVISSMLGVYSTLENAIRIYYKILLICLYIDLGIKKYCKNIVSGIYISFAIIILINFFTILKYPNGLYMDNLYKNNWFLKYDNLHIFFYFPTLLLMIINNKIKDKKYDLLDILVIIAITYSVYYCFSANTVVAYTLFVLYSIFKKKLEKIDLLNSKNYMLIFFGVFLGIIILRLQNIFNWLIVDMLGKNLTFTGRTFIWDKVLVLIKNKPLIGYGIEPSLIISTKLGSPNYTHAHNTILDIMYKGGIVSLIPFIALLILTAKELYKTRQNEISKVSSFILFCILIMMNFEAREDKIGLYIVLILCYNIKNILKINKVNVE